MKTTTPKKAKSTAFPKEIFVEIERDEDDPTSEEWFRAEKNTHDFEWDKEKKRLLGVYKLDEIVLATQVIHLHNSK